MLALCSTFLNIKNVGLVLKLNSSLIICKYKNSAELGVKVEAFIAKQESP